MDDADKCLLEYYYQEALQQGGRVHDKLRDGVEAASTNERTAIFTLLHKVAVGHTAPIFFSNKNNSLISCLLANLNSLVFDFIARQKIGGTHLTFSIFRQLPVLPPESYTPEDIEFISTRVLELVYTAWDMQPFAKDMGYEGEPFTWNSNRILKRVVLTTN